MYLTLQEPVSQLYISGAQQKRVLSLYSRLWGHERTRYSHTTRGAKYNRFSGFQIRA